MQELFSGAERISIGELIGKGGEGEVFSVSGRTDQAIKIYNSNLRQIREEKVRAMVAQSLASKTSLVAFPRQVVADRSGNFLGFIMRLVADYRPVHELYSPKSRQRHFPKADYRFLVRAALNVVKAVGNVHQTGCVIGDLNHSGILVSQSATVALIDADSFQFRLGARTYPCLVGVPDFTPPELHGKNLASIERTIAHDNFGLAVAVFHLLFMGRHPYAGRYNGPDISMGEAIAQNRFAFSLKRQSETRTTPPPGALTLDIFPDQVRSAFERAFDSKPASRPDASEWVAALTSLEISLNHCERVSAHYYPKNSKGCCWCELASKTGFDMFPDFGQHHQESESDRRDIEQAIREILGFRMPSAADFLPSPSQRDLKESQQLRQAKRQKRGKQAFGFLMILGALAGFIAFPGAFVFWIPIAIFGFTQILGDSAGSSAFKSNYERADQHIQRELDVFISRSGLQEFLKEHADVEAAIAIYKRLDDDLNQEILSLQTTRKDRQLNAFLDQYSIRSANISGIGPAKKATLISWGIETASDISYVDVRRVPGFGDVMTRKLVDWRKSIEVRFRYNAAQTPQDIADQNAIRQRSATQKTKIEGQIRGALTAQRTIKARLDAIFLSAKNDATLRQAIDARAQAEYDLKQLNVSVPTSSVSLKLTQPQGQNTKFGTNFNVGKPSAVGSAVMRPTPANTAPSCPKCGSRMQRRSGKYGQFWGCTRYPVCNGTRN